MKASSHKGCVALTWDGAPDASKLNGHILSESNEVVIEGMEMEVKGERGFRSQAETKGLFSCQCAVTPSRLQTKIRAAEVAD